MHRNCAYARFCLLEQFLRQQFADFAREYPANASTYADIAAGRNLAMLANDIHPVGRAVVRDHAETGRDKFDTNVRRPIVLMGQNRFAGLETLPAQKRNFPTRSTHHEWSNT